MATLADELLNDFEDSGSESDRENQNSFQDGNEIIATPGNDAKPRVQAIDMEVDEEDDGDEEDIDMTDGRLLNQLENADDADEAKNRVEEMQFGGISDARSVNTLKKSLEPVLEVS
jgi:U4/U6 small nuclear ribonucleoprotein PRP31